MAILTSSPGSAVDHQRVWDLGYELLEIASTETYANVWRIRDRQTYEVLAWKQLRPEWEGDPLARSSLENEAAVGRLVPSSLLLNLVAAQMDQAPRYVIWEWFEGQSVEHLLRQYYRLPIASALWIARQCAEGLHVLLSAGLTHGDLRPACVLVDPRSGLVKLTELGSSRRVAQTSSLGADKRTARSGPLADYGTVAAPAHRQGPAKDLYNLGLILYQSLAGRAPFEAETPAELVRGRQTNIADDLRRHRPEVSPEIADVVSGLLTGRQGEFEHPAVVVDRLMGLEVAELAKAG
jgi:serine/threonine-protein kinase